MWEISFLPGNQVGMLARMHHVMADGMAGVAALGALLDPVPDAEAGPARPWAPAPAPSAQALLADNLRRDLDSARRGLPVLTRPVATARSVMAAWPMLREILSGEPGPATSLDRMAGPDRRFALIRSRLGLVTEIAHAHGATVNDVLLAMIAGGLRELFRSRGEAAGGFTVPVYVPVTLRPRDRAQAQGNLISQLIVPVPVGPADPGQRLWQIAVETRGRKARSQPSLGIMFHGGAAARRVVLKLIARQRVNVTTADLPGPAQPLYLAGARLLEVFPLLPLIANVPLGVGALSYAGQFSVMAVGDAGACPDVGVFAAGAEGELAALAAAVPAASRASAAGGQE